MFDGPMGVFEGMGDTEQPQYEEWHAVRTSPNGFRSIVQRAGQIFFSSKQEMEVEIEKDKACFPPVVSRWFHYDLFCVKRDKPVIPLWEVLPDFDCFQGEK